MSKLGEIQSLIERGVNQFIAICINANRDLPFFDYDLADTTTNGVYVVGENNIQGVGDQKKHFVSKSTLLFASADTTVYFNSKNNVATTILADTYYEFKHNIHSIFWEESLEAESWLKIWVEGVMYNEARRPH